MQKGMEIFKLKYRNLNIKQKYRNLYQKETDTLFFWSTIFKFQMLGSKLLMAQFISCNFTPDLGIDQ